MDLYSCYGCGKRIVQLVKNGGHQSANGQRIKPMPDYTSLDLLIEHQGGHAAFATPVCKTCAFKAMLQDDQSYALKQVLRHNLFKMLLLYSDMIPKSLVAKGKLDFEKFELTKLRDLTKELQDNNIIP